MNIKRNLRYEQTYMKKDKKKSGIQRRYLKYTAVLLGIALLLSSLGVVVSVRERLTDSIIDKYEFMTERMGITLENMFRKSDETTAECILYDDVQKTLQAQGLEEVKLYREGKLELKTLEEALHEL